MDGGKILFIDDELYPSNDAGSPQDEDEPDGDYMWYYIRALEDAGYEVTRALGPDEALSILAGRDGGFDLIILDIMMPPEQAYEKAKTRNGTRTGLFIAKTLDEKYPQIPVVVLTNVDDPSVHKLVRSTPNVKEVFTKDEHLPFQLVETITAM